jgi:hypothetical protein
VREREREREREIEIGRGKILERNQVGIYGPTSNGADVKKYKEIKSRLFTNCKQNWN